MKKLLAISALAILAACATTGALFGPTPEAQIKTGGDTVTAAVTVNTVLLKNRKVSTVTAKSYNDLLHAAGAHLKDANTRLAEADKLIAEREKAGE